jgi:hypothetical protein
MNKPNKEQVQQWVSALRSGKYKQTTGTLQDSNGYCCLGVACDIFIPQHKIQTRFHSLNMCGECPMDQEYSPKWLKRINGHFEKQTGIEIVDLNDRHNFSFDEIADLLEAVYIHEVLN